MTVLLLSLQFHAALRFLWREESTKMYRVDAVHLAIALHQEQALTVAAATNGGCGVWGMGCVGVLGRCVNVLRRVLYLHRAAVPVNLWHMAWYTALLGDSVATYLHQREFRFCTCELCSMVAFIGIPHGYACGLCQVLPVICR